jgi:flagellar basal-body rod protein FlgB
VDLLNGIANSGSIPVAEAVLRFTSARHAVLANNVANIDTPFYRARDLDAAGFERALSEAVAARGENGALRFTESRNIRLRDGRVEFRTVVRSVDPLRHDQNDNSIETEMGLLHKNAMTARVMARFLRSRYQALRAAVSGRSL